MLAGAFLVAGCGGGEPPPAPQLPAALAESLAARSDVVAEQLERGDACAARAEAEALQTEAIEAVNGGRVADPFQEQLLGSATALAESIECAPPPPAAEEDVEDEQDDKDRGEDEGNGKQKGKDKD